MAECAPGEVAEVDFGRLGLLEDQKAGHKRLLHALVVTLVYSRYQYVWITFRQDLSALINGIEEAWIFFGGVSRRLVIDNLRAAVVKSDRYAPIFQRTFLEYSQHREFILDPALVRHLEGKPVVERQIPYVRENFFKGESFRDREHVQQEAILWCQMTAGMPIHGTTRQRPRMVFEQEEQSALLPLSPDWRTIRSSPIRTVQSPPRSPHPFCLCPLLRTHPLNRPTDRRPKRQSPGTPLSERGADQDPSRHGSGSAVHGF